MEITRLVKRAKRKDADAFTELMYSNEFTEVDFIISSIDINPFEKI